MPVCVFVVSLCVCVCVAVCCLSDCFSIVCVPACVRLAAGAGVGDDELQQRRLQRKEVKRTTKLG